ncbi:sodium- and chloride-dependent taurine transporter-like [Watersipora subatra]|uniref:sodium- and chloride-dependent taurine transporter-like n=1 Tax=Watersipora subatra TaxID=2589382 RepID=UPI00355B82D9
MEKSDSFALQSSEENGSAVSPDPESGKTGNKRETFNNKIDFLMACVGYSVGFGNVWRFPYLCYKNGGGAFLLPYFIMVVLAGIPMFLLEVSIGQFMSAGGIKVWNISPLFIGIGFATTIILFLLNCYYNVILSWALYYLFASFSKVVPWSHCDHDWNTEHCTTDWSKFTSKYNATAALANITVNGTVYGNTSYYGNETRLDYYTDPATEYWMFRVLNISSGIQEAGQLKWDLSLCLLLAWIIVFACIAKGVKTSGKVMYVTATLPYVFMIILLIRNCMLPGAEIGIKFYLTPNATKLASMQTWVDAGTQIFFSYSIGIGASTALGSFNKFHHNSYRDTIIFACVNSGTSFLAGFVIFSILGHMSYEQSVDISEVAESGPGLAFIAYPKALATMPIAPMWSIFFFVMLILLGLDSQFVAQEGLVAAIVDLFPVTLRKGYRRVLFTGLMCVICFFIGLSMVTQGGMYVFQIFDFYSGSRIILLVALFECIAVAYVFGVDRYLDSVAIMYGFRINIVWKWLYLIVAPLVVTIVFILNCISYSTLTYKFSAHRIYEYPPWAISVGWLMACSSIIMVPIFAIWAVVRKLLFDQSLTWMSLIRPKLLPHQMRLQDNPRDINPDATPENTFLPTDVLKFYREGTLTPRTSTGIGKGAQLYGEDDSKQF